MQKLMTLTRSMPFKYQILVQMMVASYLALVCHVVLMMDNVWNIGYKCDICNKTFHAKQSKEYHIIHHHTAPKQSEKCGICHATFTSTVSLRNHLKYIHSRRKKIFLLALQCYLQATEKLKSPHISYT